MRRIIAGACIIIFLLSPIILTLGAFIILYCAGAWVMGYYPQVR